VTAARVGSRPWRSLWGVGKVLLLVSLVPLAIAAASAFVPVENPGVQRCGGPLPFVVERQRDLRLDPAVVDAATYEAQRAQAPCSERVAARLRVGFTAGAVFVSLALLGALIGLVDDRRRLRAEPRFEQLLRERPKVSRP
jgi:hypothetical protein